MLSPTCTQQSHFLHPSSWKNEQWESRGWIKASLFPLVAGGDEEYIYMNKVTVNKQQGDQEKQDKGREFKIAGCLIPNRVVGVRVATRAFLSWDQWWSLWQLWELKQLMVWKDCHFHYIPLEIVVLANTEVIPGSSTLEGIILGLKCCLLRLAIPVPEIFKEAVVFPLAMK